VLDLNTSKVIEQFFEDNEYRNFQWEDLGVYGGAFGLSHNSRENFILLQPTDLPEYPTIRGLNIPYLPESELDADRYKDLIDYLFLKRRGAGGQPLLGRDDLASAFGPEFYWHLAKIYVPQQTGSQHWHGRIPLCPFNQYLYEVKVPYLYCPIGEIVFVLYAWRMLIRRCQKFKDLTARVEAGQLALNEQGCFQCEDIWCKELLGELNPSLPESEWLTALEELESLWVKQWKDNEIYLVNSEYQTQNELIFTDAAHGQGSTVINKDDLVAYSCAV
jgi:hypothetical protein